MGTGKIKVIVVDDSAFIRELLTSLLNSDPDIVVVDSAPDPYVAREKIKLHNPDVITLDIEMPRMDGLDFLRKIMALRPMAVVMVSSLTQTGADATIKALEIGAVDFVGKPAMDIAAGMEAKRAELIAKVKAAARARVSRRALAPEHQVQQLPSVGYLSTEKIIAIGASTGGVEALTEVLRPLPADSPAIVITQHMPRQFTGGFAARLDGLCAIHVCEAEHGQRILPGHAYIAPGDRHLEVGRSGANYVARVEKTQAVGGHVPAVDVMFHSVARSVGPNAIGVILTGMGKDGAEGLLAMRRAGARTIGQNEESCVVYGMPHAAYEMGGVEQQLPLPRIAGGMMALASASARGVRAVRV